MALKVIFIDIDNTLLDFDDHVKTSLKEGFDYFHLPSYQEGDFERFEAINTPLWKRLEKGEISFEYIRDNRFQFYFDSVGVKMDGRAFEAYFRKAIRNHAKLIDGVIPFLEALKGRAILCAASNSPVGQQAERLALGGIRPYFDFVFVSEEVGYSKPDERFFIEAIARVESEKKIQIKRDECLIIGDSLTSDIQGGKNAKMHTILFLKHPNSKLKGDEAEFISDSLIEIGEYLKKNKFIM